MNRSARATARRIPPLLARRVGRLLSQLPGALRSDEESIHELRVAARRLRAVLPWLAKKPKSPRVRHAQRRLRELTRAFGECRDFDVALPLLRARVRTLAASRQRDLLVVRLRRARTRARHEMARSVAQLDLRRLRRTLRAIVAGSDGSQDALERLQAARSKRSRELRILLTTRATAFDPDALHRIRIRARKLRYMAEALDALRQKQSAAPALLRQLQDDLGPIHDLHVLAEWLAAQATDLDAQGEGASAAEARSLARYFHRLGRQRQRAFLATKPAAILRRAVAIMKGNPACEP